MMDDIPLIDTATLNQTWPRDWIPRHDEQFAPGNALCELQIERAPHVKSLSEITLNTVVEEFLDHLDYDAFKEAEELIVFLPALRSYLRDHPEVINGRPCGFKLLRKTMRGDAELRLSAFPALTGDQIIELCIDAGDVRLLDLSGNHNINVQNLESILERAPIRKLCIWDSQNLPVSAVLPLAGPRLQKVIHRELYLAAFIERQITRNIDLCLELFFRLCSRNQLSLK
jgi:hypothetical protein